MSNNIKIPAKYIERQNDHVSYKVIEKNKHSLIVDNVCYYNHMGKSNKYEFHLFPSRECKNWEKYFIDNENYINFINLFKEYNLITPKTKAEIIDGKPNLIIPRDTSSHRTFAAMCAYRWCESLSPLVWLILHLHNKKKDVSFWQILHYAMGTKISNSNHNWCEMSQTEFKNGYVYANGGQSWNLGFSLSFPIFWNKTENELKETTGPTSDNMTKLCDQIAPCVKTKTMHMKRPKLLINGEPNKISILEPKWTMLYKLAGNFSHWNTTNLNKELETLYNEIVKDDKELQELTEKIDNPKTSNSGRIVY